MWSSALLPQLVAPSGPAADSALGAHAAPAAPRPHQALLSLLLAPGAAYSHLAPRSIVLGGPATAFRPDLQGWGFLEVIMHRPLGHVVGSICAP